MDNVHDVLIENKDPLETSFCNPHMERRGNVWNVLKEDEAPLRKGMTFVKHLSFQGYATDMDHVRVVDVYDNVVFDTYGNADLSPVEVELCQWVREMRVLDLTAGQLVVVVK